MSCLPERIYEFPMCFQSTSSPEVLNRAQHRPCEKVNAFRIQVTELAKGSLAISPGTT